MADVRSLGVAIKTLPSLKWQGYPQSANAFESGRTLRCTPLSHAGRLGRRRFSVADPLKQVAVWITKVNADPLAAAASAKYRQTSEVGMPTLQMTGR
jgi:hypothetical protein